MTDRAEGGGRSDHNQKTGWRPRDYLAAALLFGTTAAFVIWQNSRVAVLWDLGYLLDSSWRMALGQMPYRDFPFAHAPLTFLIQAVLIRVSGRHYFVQIGYAATAGGLATVMTWRVLLRVARMGKLDAAAGTMALLLAVPLCVTGIYCIYPHPIYDCDCTLAILIAVLLLASLSQEMSSTMAARWAGLAAGCATVVPLFFKQNIGLPFLAVVAAGGLVLVAAELRRTRSFGAAIRSQPAFILAGMAGGLAIAFGIVAITAGLGNYFLWTVQFAAQRRLPGLSSMLGVYAQPAFVWTVPVLFAGFVLCHTPWITRWWARAAAFCLIAAPFVGSLIFLMIDDDADERADNLLALWPLLLLASFVAAIFELRRGITLGRLIPFFLLAAIHGTFLSQQLWGSTYALWPLLMVLVAFFFAAFPAQARAVAVAAGFTISVTFLVCGSLYAVSLERLRYVQIPDAPLQRSSLPALRGMATPGLYLSNLDELADFVTREIPPGDVVLPIPGEDPFYFVTGRMPKFPVTLFDPATDPYSASALMVEAQRRNVRWVIVKRTLQITENPEPGVEETMRLLVRDFVLNRRLKGYDIFRRRQDKP